MHVPAVAAALRLAPVLLLAFASCTTLRTTVPFAAVDEVETPPRAHLAEGGHGEPVRPPAGVRWTLSLSGVREEPLRGPPTQRYELHVTLTDERPGAGAGSLHLDPRRVVLVDDDGRRLRPTRMLWPEEEDSPEARRRARRAGAPQEMVLVFDLPDTYRFRRIGHVTVHWTLDTGARTLAISTRFRS